MSKIAKIQGAGVDMKGAVQPATIEVEVRDEGIGIHVVGLPDTLVKETLLRVITALQSKGFVLPSKKTIINIAPAMKSWRGTGFDLPIAIGILQASGQIKASEERLARCTFFGELGLDGTIHQVDCGLGYSLALATFANLGERPLCLVTDKCTALEASVYNGVIVYQFGELSKLLRVLQQDLEGGLVGTANLIYLSKEYREATLEWADEVIDMSQRPL